jgi:hypothetical protein
LKRFFHRLYILRALFPTGVFAHSAAELRKRTIIEGISPAGNRFF